MGEKIGEVKKIDPETVARIAHFQGTITARLIELADTEI